MKDKNLNTYTLPPGVNPNHWQAGLKHHINLLVQGFEYQGSASEGRNLVYRNHAKNEWAFIRIFEKAYHDPAGFISYIEQVNSVTIPSVQYTYSANVVFVTDEYVMKNHKSLIEKLVKPSQAWIALGTAEQIPTVADVAKYQEQVAHYKKVTLNSDPYWSDEVKLWNEQYGPAFKQGQLEFKIDVDTNDVMKSLLEAKELVENDIAQKSTEPEYFNTEPVIEPLPKIKAFKLSQYYKGKYYEAIITGHKSNWFEAHDLYDESSPQFKHMAARAAMVWAETYGGLISGHSFGKYDSMMKKVPHPPVDPRPAKCSWGGCPVDHSDEDWNCLYTERSIFNMVQHLNDNHKWTRERIADWLDTLDEQPTFYPIESARIPCSARVVEVEPLVPEKESGPSTSE